MPTVRHSSTRPEPLVTPYRIAAAASRLRRTFTRAAGDASMVFGTDSVAWESLRQRVDALAEATHMDSTTAALPPPVKRLLLNLANAGRHAERVHELATWMLALAQAIETESNRASSLAVCLGVILGECELIAAAVDDNAERVAA